MHFGKYLLELGVVTPEQVLDALDLQRRAGVFLGTLAVREGVMTVEQVLTVLDDLNANRPPALRFGDFALRRGFIDEETRNRLVELQKSQFAPIGEVLVQQGVLSDKRMAALLKDFIRDAEIGRRTSAESPVSST